MDFLRQIPRPFLVPCLVFLGLLALLIWLVSGGFQKLGMHEWKQPSEPVRVFILTRAASRRLGVGLTSTGILLMSWMWDMAHGGQLFDMKAAVLGPLLMGMGMWMMVEAPLAPDGLTFSRLFPIGWVLCATGFAAGIVYAEFLKTGRIPFVRP